MMFILELERTIRGAAPMTKWLSLCSSSRTLMVLNEAIWSGFGKILFCLADVAMIPAIFELTETTPQYETSQWVWKIVA